VERSEWKYEMRRKFQPILSFLYLGPSSAARDIDALRKEGITMLLVIRDTMTAQARMLSGAKVAEQLGIEAGAIDVSGNMELIAAFPRATSSINDHLIRIFRQRNPQGISNSTDVSEGPIPKVLVFCESGNERSAAVVVAYIMATYELGLVEAIQYVQNQRFCVAFDDEMKHTLLNYHQLLEAKRSVFEARQATPVAIKSKRRHDEEETDIDMDHQDDIDRFVGRSKFAPFQ
jgi:serine/threonine/tyrosine-interacting protein